MFFMQPSKYPGEPFTKYIEAHRMHLYTLIQLFLFGLLYTVQSLKPIAIAFSMLLVFQ
jgi:hypothetical protein